MIKWSNVKKVIAVLSMAGSFTAVSFGLAACGSSSESDSQTKDYHQYRKGKGYLSFRIVNGDSGSEVSLEKKENPYADAVEAHESASMEQFVRLAQDTDTNINKLKQRIAELRNATDKAATETARSHAERWQQELLPELQNRLEVEGAKATILSKVNTKAIYVFEADGRMMKSFEMEAFRQIVKQLFPNGEGKFKDMLEEASN